MKISGFTFVHNALVGGYPIVEAIHAVQPYVDEIVVINCASTDGTKDLLEKLVDISIYDIFGKNKRIPLRVLDGEWGNEAGETLRQAHNKYIECAGDMIVHFEADEVYGDRLIRSIINHVKAGHDSLSVYRLQLEQNFQRCRWYPEPVHRVFSRLSGVRKKGHTTDQHEKSFLLTEKNGYLWDITNCFRDNWFDRVEAQAKLRNEKPNYLITGHHCTWPVHLKEKDARQWVYSGKHWTWKHTPFNIPEILNPLVGMVKYEPRM
jgi:hypothetical protein